MHRIKTIFLALAFALFTMPAHADDTSYIQGLINAGVPTIVPCGWYVVNGGLTVPSGGVTLTSASDKCAFLSVSSNVNILSCSGISALVRVSGIVFVGNASGYTGYGTGSTSSGQNGIKLHNCSNFFIYDVSLANLNGNAIDCDEPSSAFNVSWFGTIQGAILVNNYKGIYTHQGCEYVNIADVQARANVFGFHIASGNVNATNNQVVYNSIGIKIEGNSTDVNPCHGTVSSSSFNHNTYNAIVQSCGAGETFSGDNFIADQSSSVLSGTDAGIQIFNSRGISFVGGQLGSDIAITAADPITSSSALNGYSLVSQMFLHTELTNFGAPTLNAGTAILIKGNFDGSGLWSANN